MSRTHLLAALLGSSLLLTLPVHAEERDRTVIEEGQAVDADSLKRALDLPLGRSANKERSVAIPLQFEFGKATLTVQGQTVLDTVAVVLNDPAFVSATFVVEGHTDSVGSAANNLKLSEARAQTAMTYLIGKNVAAGRLKAVGYGKGRLLPNIAPTAGVNRRVEIVREVYP